MSLLLVDSLKMLFNSFSIRFCSSNDFYLYKRVCCNGICHLLPCFLPLSLFWWQGLYPILAPPFNSLFYICIFCVALTDLLVCCRACKMTSGVTSKCSKIHSWEAGSALMRLWMCVIPDVWQCLIVIVRKLVV
jgi:hypothetical protein